MVRGGLSAAVFAAGLLACGPAGSFGGAAEAIDGDTLRVAGETVRLHAIDAPEAMQTCRDAAGRAWPCGAAATEALSSLLIRDVRCDGRERDRYGRLVATCYSGGADIAEQMVRSGNAFVSVQYGRDYVAAERQARAARVGVWQGRAERPSQVRARSRDRAAAQRPPPDGCPIKGNISSNGRIFHLPGQAHYARTRIDTSRGERWFCSKAEALGAGWRPARR